MDVLKQVMAQPVDPDYAIVAARGQAPSRGRWMLLVTLIALGALLAVAAMQNSRTAPVQANERTELITRVRAAEARQDELQNQAATLDAEIRQRRESQLDRTEEDRALRDELAALEIQSGAIAVKGPGVVVVVDDATGDEANGRVVDIDLQQLVNGLRMAGAEAVAINGHRLSSVTAIRGAGDAITVDYRSLTRPYRVEAIGDPLTMQSRYVESAGGRWWATLHQTYGLRHDVSTSRELELAGDPGQDLRHAKVKGER